VAVAAAVALIGGLVWGLGRGDHRTEVADETGRVTAEEPRVGDLGVATSACQAFAGGTYGGFTLSELTGPTNGSVITTAGGAQLGTAQLEAGFGALAAGLETSGFRSDELDATVSRIDSNLRRAERRAADEKLAESQKVLRRVGEDLVGLDAILRDLGVPSCF
jgi:hypothetical protein